MKLFCTLQILFFGWMLTTAAARADDSQAIFEQGNRLYEQGKFGEAAASYQKIIESGHGSAALFFNLGNALFKSGQIGRAILNYRLAERLKPRDPDVNANLQFARNQVSGSGQPRQALWQRAARRLTLNEWTGWTMAFLWTVFSLLALGQLRPSWAAACRTYATVAALATVFYAGGLYLDYQEQYVHQDAVVTVPESIARYGPVDKSPSFFSLSNGAEVSITDRLNGWAQVADGAGRKGWVPDNGLAVVAIRERRTSGSK